MSKLAWGGANYSTEEQVVGTWINGKPLYQKTIVTTTPSDNNPKFVNIGASISMGTVVNAVMNDNDGHWFNAYCAAANDSSKLFRVGVFDNSETGLGHPNTLRIDCWIVDWQNKSFYTTIQYTKTTD